MKSILNCILIATILSSTSLVGEDISKPKFLEAVRKRLASKEGLTGLVHGLEAESSIYVLAIYLPPITPVHFSLIADPAAVEQMKKLRRHDRVKVWGELSELGSQPHIQVSRVEVQEPFPNSGKYQYEPGVLDEIKSKNEITAVVHAIGPDIDEPNKGKVLVLDYRDQIVIVPVKDTTLTENLWRGDIVTIRYRVRPNPPTPLHLELESLKTETKIHDLDGKSATLEGNLVFYGPNPVLSVKVFAVREKAGDYPRTYFLVGAGEETMAKIADKFGPTWEKTPGAESLRGGSSWINRQISVKISGTISITDPGQGNPQLVVEDIDVDKAKIN